MKKILFLAILMAFVSGVIYGKPYGDKAKGKTQESAERINITRDKAGNFIAVGSKVKEKKTDKKTDFVFIDTDSTRHTVYEGSKGGLYYWAKSKSTGRNYKCYLPKY